MEEGNLLKLMQMVWSITNRHGRI